MYLVYNIDYIHQLLDESKNEKLFIYKTAIYYKLCKKRVKPNPRKRKKKR
jgi:hypothetical protein